MKCSFTLLSAMMLARILEMVSCMVMVTESPCHIYTLQPNFSPCFIGRGSLPYCEYYVLLYLLECRVFLIEVGNGLRWLKLSILSENSDDQCLITICTTDKITGIGSFKTFYFYVPVIGVSMSALSFSPHVCVCVCLCVCVCVWFLHICI